MTTDTELAERLERAHADFYTSVQTEPFDVELLRQAAARLRARAPDDAEIAAIRGRRAKANQLPGMFTSRDAELAWNHFVAHAQRDIDTLLSALATIEAETVERCAKVAGEMCNARFLVDPFTSPAVHVEGAIRSLTPAKQETQTKEKDAAG